ncbi:unnamed protein product [Calicophoron daubneyi]|uniref:Uncharacterized protein n=1 Tax=Calicophoron daubneyi TaxID=300641 RepID=A0AAV2TD37_CALDB
MDLRESGEVPIPAESSSHGTADAPHPSGKVLRFSNPTELGEKSVPSRRALSAFRRKNPPSPSATDQLQPTEREFSEFVHSHSSVKGLQPNSAAESGEAGIPQRRAKSAFSCRPDPQVNVSYCFARTISIPSGADSPTDLKVVGSRPPSAPQPYHPVLPSHSSYHSRFHCVGSANVHHQQAESYRCRPCSAFIVSHVKQCTAYDHLKLCRKLQSAGAKRTSISDLTEIQITGHQAPSVECTPRITRPLSSYARRDPLGKNNPDGLLDNETTSRVGTVARQSSPCDYIAIPSVVGGDE